MKKKMNSLAVLGIILLFGLGYAIPAVVMAVEDNGLQSEMKTFEIEEIELNFNNVDLTEELQIIPNLLVSDIIVERGKEESENSQKYNMVKLSVEYLFTILGIEQEIEFEKFSASYYVSMMETSDENVYPLWVCYGVDANKNEYYFWIDDMTGKVLAFAIPIGVMGVSVENFYNAMLKLGEYYGYSPIGFMESYREEIFKLSYWENVLLMEDEEKGEEIGIIFCKTGEKLYFNVYPGTISTYVYDTIGNTAESDK